MNVNFLYLSKISLSIKCKCRGFSFTFNHMGAFFPKRKKGKQETQYFVQFFVSVARVLVNRSGLAGVPLVNWRPDFPPLSQHNVS